MVSRVARRAACELVAGDPAFDQCQRAAGVAEHVGVRRQHLQPGTMAAVACWLAERFGDGETANPAVAVPLGLACAGMVPVTASSMMVCSC